MFSLRIVTTDHYQTTPTPGLDVQYSELRGSNVWKVPVVRIYGTTPGGQKTCMHVHGVFPYLYVPYDGTQPWDRYLRLFANSLDKALNVSLNNANAKTQHVYKINLVSGIPMYGYHDKEEQFLKIFLYNPGMVKKAADLLLGGAVMNKAFQPHEAHIPYVLQMFIDYNLYGMNMVNVAAVKFRREKKDEHGDRHEEVKRSQGSDTSCPHTPTSLLDRSTLGTPARKIWDRDNIPEDMYLDELVTRQSTCELECDIVAPDILNRQEVDANIGTNPGLAALWEDEKQRKRNMGESSQITPPPSPERVDIEISESDEAFRLKFQQIVQNHQPYMDSQPDDESQESLSSSTPASALDLQLSQDDLANASQDTVMFDEDVDDDDEVKPIISMDSIKKVVSRSQSFIGSQPKVDSQDKSLAEILASLADESPLGSSQEQIVALEEQDSILLDKAQPVDEEVAQQQEEETLEMSQVVWDQDGEEKDQEKPGTSSAAYDMAGLDDSWNVSQFLRTEESDDDNVIPQYDGAGDDAREEKSNKKRLGTRGPVIPASGQGFHGYNPYIQQQVQGQMAYHHGNIGNVGRGLPMDVGMADHMTNSQGFQKGYGSLQSPTQTHQTHQNIIRNSSCSPASSLSNIQSPSQDSQDSQNSPALSCHSNIQSPTGSGRESEKSSNPGQRGGEFLQSPRMTPSPENDNFTVHHFSHRDVLNSSQSWMGQEQLTPDYHGNMLNQQQPHWQASQNDNKSHPGFFNYYKNPPYGQMMTNTQQQMYPRQPAGQTSPSFQQVSHWNNQYAMPQRPPNPQNGPRAMLSPGQQKQPSFAGQGHSTRHGMVNPGQQKMPSQGQGQSTTRGMVSPSHQMPSQGQGQSTTHGMISPGQQLSSQAQSTNPGMISPGQQTGQSHSAMIRSPGQRTSPCQQQMSSPQTSATFKQPFNAGKPGPMPSPSHRSHSPRSNPRQSPLPSPGLMQSPDSVQNARADMSKVQNARTDSEFTFPRGRDQFPVSSAGNTAVTGNNSLQSQRHNQQQLVNKAQGIELGRSLNQQGQNHNQESHSMFQQGHNHQGQNQIQQGLSTNCQGQNFNQEGHSMNQQGQGMNWQVHNQNQQGQSFNQGQNLNRGDPSQYHLPHQNVVVSSSNNKSQPQQVSPLDSQSMQHQGQSLPPFNSLTARSLAQVITSSVDKCYTASQGISASSQQHEQYAQSMSVPNHNQGEGHLQGQLSSTTGPQPDQAGYSSMPPHYQQAQHYGNPYYSSSSQQHQSQNMELSSFGEKSFHDLLMEDLPSQNNEENSKYPVQKMNQPGYSHSGSANQIQNGMMQYNMPNFPQMQTPEVKQKPKRGRRPKSSKPGEGNQTEGNQAEGTEGTVKPKKRKKNKTSTTQQASSAMLDNMMKNPPRAFFGQNYQSLSQQGMPNNSSGYLNEDMQKLKSNSSSGSLIGDPHPYHGSQENKTGNQSVNSAPSRQPSTLERLLLYGDENAGIDNTPSNNEEGPRKAEKLEGVSRQNSHPLSPTGSADLFSDVSQSSVSSRLVTPGKTGSFSGQGDYVPPFDKINPSSLGRLERFVGNVNEGTNYGYHFKSPVKTIDMHLLASPSFDSMHETSNQSCPGNKSPAFGSPNYSNRSKSPAQSGSRSPSHCTKQPSNVMLNRSMSYDGSQAFRGHQDLTDGFQGQNNTLSQDHQNTSIPFTPGSQFDNNSSSHLNKSWSEFSSQNSKPNHPQQLMRSQSYTPDQKGRQRKDSQSSSVTKRPPPPPNAAYTFQFHVPTPIFKRLKLKQNRQLNSSDVKIVRMHPMDARKYSLLKIGREVVKVKKLTQYDIDQSGINLKASLHELLEEAKTNLSNKQTQPRSQTGKEIKAPYNIKTHDVKLNSVENKTGDNRKNCVESSAAMYPQRMIVPPAQTLASLSDEHCHIIQKVTLTSIIDSVLSSSINKDESMEINPNRNPATNQEASRTTDSAGDNNKEYMCLDDGTVKGTMNQEQGSGKGYMSMEHPKNHELGPGKHYMDGPYNHEQGPGNHFMDRPNNTSQHYHSNTYTMPYQHGNFGSMGPKKMFNTQDGFHHHMQTGFQRPNPSNALMNHNNNTNGVNDMAYPMPGSNAQGINVNVKDGMNAAQGINDNGRDRMNAAHGMNDNGRDRMNAAQGINDNGRDRMNAAQGINDNGRGRMNPIPQINVSESSHNSSVPNHVQGNFSANLMFPHPGMDSPTIKKMLATQKFNSASGVPQVCRKLEKQPRRKNLMLCRKRSMNKMLTSSPSVIDPDLEDGGVVLKDVSLIEASEGKLTPINSRTPVAGRSPISSQVGENYKLFDGDLLNLKDDIENKLKEIGQDIGNGSKIFPNIMSEREDSSTETAVTSDFSSRTSSRVVSTESAQSLNLDDKDGKSDNPNKQSQLDNMIKPKLIAGESFKSIINRQITDILTNDTSNESSPPKKKLPESGIAVTEEEFSHNKMNLSELSANVDYYLDEKTGMFEIIERESGTDSGTSNASFVSNSSPINGSPGGLMVKYRRTSWAKVKSPGASDFSSESSQDSSYFRHHLLNGDDNYDKSEGYYKGVRKSLWIAQSYEKTKKKPAMSLNHKMQVAFLGRKNKRRRKHWKKLDKNIKKSNAISGLSLLHEATLASLTDSKGVMLDHDERYDDVMYKLSLYSSPETESLDSSLPLPLSPEELAIDKQGLSRSTSDSQSPALGSESSVSPAYSSTSGGTKKSPIYPSTFNRLSHVLNQSEYSEDRNGDSDYALKDMENSNESQGLSEVMKEKIAKQVVVKLKRLSVDEIDAFRRERRKGKTGSDSPPDLGPPNIPKYNNPLLSGDESVSPPRLSDQEIVSISSENSPIHPSRLSDQEVVSLSSETENSPIYPYSNTTGDVSSVIHELHNEECSQGSGSGSQVTLSKLLPEENLSSHEPPNITAELNHNKTVADESHHSENVMQGINSEKTKSNISISANSSGKLTSSGKTGDSSNGNESTMENHCDISTSTVTTGDKTSENKFIHRNPCDLSTNDNTTDDYTSMNVCNGGNPCDGTSRKGNEQTEDKNSKTRNGNCQNGSDNQKCETNNGVSEEKHIQKGDGKDNMDQNNSENGQFNQLKTDATVIKPKLPPPSWKHVEDTALSHGLNLANNQAAFCSNPDDLPEKPRELGGRILKIESFRVSDLEDFTSSIESDGLPTWREILCAGDQFLGNHEVTEKLSKEPQLLHAIIGDRPVIMTPCRLAPKFKDVSNWMIGRQKYKQSLNAVKNIGKSKDSSEKESKITKEKENKCVLIENKFIQPLKLETKLRSVSFNETCDDKMLYSLCDKGLSVSHVSREAADDIEMEGKSVKVNNMNSQNSDDMEEDDDVIGPSPPKGTGMDDDDVIGPSPPNDTGPLTQSVRPLKKIRLFSTQQSKTSFSPNATGSLFPSQGQLHSTPLQRARTQGLNSSPIQVARMQRLHSSPVLMARSQRLHSTPVQVSRLQDFILPACTPIDHLQTPRRAPLSKRLSVGSGRAAGDSNTPSQLNQYATPDQKGHISQIDGPTPKNSFGFQVSQQNFNDAKALHEIQNITVLSLELLAETRGDHRPDPEVDAVQAVFYSILNDVPPEKGKREVTGVILVDPGSARSQRELEKHNLSKQQDDSTPQSTPGSSNSSTPSSQKPSTSKDDSTPQSTPGSQKPSTSKDTRCSASRPPSSQGSSRSKRKTKKKVVSPSRPDTSQPGDQTLLQKSGIDDTIEITYVETEKDLFQSCIDLISKWDPEILVGWEVQKVSWGYLLQRAAHIGINLCSQISRVPDDKKASHFSAQKDEYGADHMSEIHIVGRIVINLWRIIRHEVSLNIYSFENVMFHMLHQRVPLYSFKSLNSWYNHRTHLYRWRVLNYFVMRVKANLQIIDQVDLIGRTSEFARVFGIEFYHVLSRGSQYRVESMMLRIAKPLNYIPASPSIHQRARMRAPECIALTLEPESRFYHDPVVVVDFQSLYPSIMIAYNYCFSTCVGRINLLEKAHEGSIEFGSTSLKIPPSVLKKIKDDITVSPNGVVFVKQHVRKGVISAMVEDILNTRIMVKKAMKDYKKDKTLHRLLDARQLGLKLIANVTYGYTAANFSGRMPCIEVADSIVRKARETLERSIKLVEDTPRWGAKVVYGDTDSMFILLKGRSKEDAFKIGYEICDAVTAMHPSPIKLKFEKVYLPCVLQTKKRYVGFSYETPDQKEPIFDAKGIETVRRDACPAVAKILERSIKVLFTTKDVSQVKQYVQNQCRKLMEGKVSMQDLTFAKEYRGMPGYKPGACVPALEISRKLLRLDRRSEPCVGERVPYVIVYGSPGLPLIQLVRQPWDVLSDPSLRINATYYITKQILPPLDRMLSLLGVDVLSWYNDMPKVVRVVPQSLISAENKKGTISQYFSASNCPVCDKPTNQNVCNNCLKDPQTVAIVLNSRIKKWETVYHRLLEICNSCMGVQDDEQPCVSLNCPIMYRRNVAYRDNQKSSQMRDILSKCLDF